MPNRCISLQGAHEMAHRLVAFSLTTDLFSFLCRCWRDDQPLKTLTFWQETLSTLRSVNAERCNLPICRMKNDLCPLNDIKMYRFSINQVFLGVVGQGLFVSYQTVLWDSASRMAAHKGFLTGSDIRSDQADGFGGLDFSVHCSNLKL